MLVIILEFLAEQLGNQHMTGCREATKDLGEIFRLDAKAAGTDVAVGGWVSRGRQTTQEAKWFAVRLNRNNAPWAFARGEPFRVVASLELLGVLLGLMVLAPEKDFPTDADSTGLITLGCLTDNQGNSFLLDKLMTTSYPLGLVLIELAWQCSRRRIALRAEWVPRLQNEEADDLTNWDFTKFRPENRVEVKLDEMRFGVLSRLLETGESYFQEIEAAKQQAKEAKEKGVNLNKGAGKGRRKKLRDGSLRETDPW